MLRGIFFAVAGALVLHLAAGIGIGHQAAANDDVSRAEQTGQQPSRFIAPAAASMIVLPGSASASDRAAGDEVAAQQALLRRAETEANAAAEIRRKAEDLSRRFVAEHGVSGAPSTDTSIAPIGMTRAAALVPAPVAQNESVPATLHSPASSAIVTEPDPLGDARRQAAEADARAAAERAARLSAEASAGLAIEQAAAALARAKRDAEAAARRADAAEARAMKATREAQRNMAKAATAAVAAGKQKSDVDCDCGGKTGAATVHRHRSEAGHGHGRCQAGAASAARGVGRASDAAAHRAGQAAVHAAVTALPAEYRAQLREVSGRDRPGRYVLAAASRAKPHVRSAFKSST